MYTWATRWETLETERLSSESWGLSRPGEEWNVGSAHTLTTRWKTLETEMLSTGKWGLCTLGRHVGKL